MDLDILQTPTRQKYSLLLSAYACEPGKGSEPGIGWRWAVCLAQAGHRVCVITRENNRALIEEALRKYDLPNIEFVYYDLPVWVRWWKKRGLGVYLYYLLWQWGIFGVAKHLCEGSRFDFIQHITFGVFRQPSFLAFLNVPFIFGPVGGGETAPFRLRAGFPLRGYLIDGLRDMANRLVKIDPLMHRVYRRSHLILCKTVETLNSVPVRYHNKCKVRLEIGIDDFSEPKNISQSFSDSGKQLHILYVGRLIYWKGLHLGIRALARLLENKIDVKLTVIGKGPDEKNFLALAKSLRVDHVIEWIPQTDRARLMAMYQQYDVFLFPSLHDSSSNVVLEAMSRGLPVVCLDLGGPGSIVSRSSGFKIAPTNISQISFDLSQALYTLAKNPSLLSNMSQAAINRAMKYSWPNQVKRMERIYKEYLTHAMHEEQKCVLQS